MPIYCATFNRRQQRSLMATSRKAILALLSFILPLLTNLINLKFQNESNSVFQARPKTTLVAIAGYWYLPCHLESSPPSILFISLLPVLLSSVLSWCFPVPSHWHHWLHSCSQMHGDLGYMSSTSCFHLATACVDWSESGESGFSKG